MPRLYHFNDYNFGNFITSKERKITKKLFLVKHVLLITLLLLLPLTIYSQDGKRFSISFGPVDIGESRLPITLSDFSVIKNVKGHKIEASFVKNSVEWIRNNNNLLTPRARLAITIFRSTPSMHIHYLGQSILFEEKDNKLHTEIYVSLFNPGRVHVVSNGKRIGYIAFVAHPPKIKGKTQLIDYSCARYNLQLEGLEQEYISIGCHLSRTGDIMEEKPRLEVTWASTNFRLLDGSLPPYVTVFTGSNPAKIKVQDQHGKTRIITIKVSLPKRLKRLRTALGFGPYIFDAKLDSAERSPKVAPTFMIYANFYLSPLTSIRAFDALVWQDSIFNNFGLYFAYEVAEAFDQRVSIVPLLGIQGLTFKYNKRSEAHSQVIYPQGFEILIRHPFGLENYLAFYGMFLSTSSEYDYTNAWIRFGKRVFWELNWIEWGDSRRHTSMWGLSLGIPFMSFF